MWLLVVRTQFLDKAPQGRTKQQQTTHTTTATRHDSRHMARDLSGFGIGIGQSPGCCFHMCFQSANKEKRVHWPPLPGTQDNNHPTTNQTTGS